MLENRGQADEERVGLFWVVVLIKFVQTCKRECFVLSILLQTYIAHVLGQNICFDKEKLAITGNPGFVILQP